LADVESIHWLRTAGLLVGIPTSRDSSRVQRVPVRKGRDTVALRLINERG